MQIWFSAHSSPFPWKADRSVWYFGGELIQLKAP